MKHATLFSKQTERNYRMIYDLMEGEGLRPTAILYAVSHTRVEQILQDVLAEIAPNLKGMYIPELREKYGGMIMELLESLIAKEERRKA